MSNLYVISDSPVQCALFLPDQMLGQSVVDSNDLLKAAVDYHSDINNALHSNIVAKWVRETRSNYIWTLEYFEQLCHEFNKRFNTGHPLLLNTAELENNMIYIPQGSQTKFANNAVSYGDDVDFTFINDVNDAYKLMLTNLWEKSKNPPTWGGIKKNW